MLRSQERRFGLTFWPERTELLLAPAELLINRRRRETFQLPTSLNLALLPAAFGLSAEADTAKDTDGCDNISGAQACSNQMTTRNFSGFDTSIAFQTEARSLILWHGRTVTHW